MTYLKLEAATVLPGDAELDAVETELGYSLPDDYRDFLKQTNGGSPTAFHVFPIKECGEEAMLHYFNSVGQSIEILDEFSTFEDDLPRGFIVIGSDPGGNLILMDLSDKEATPVYYWDRAGHFRRKRTKKSEGTESTPKKRKRANTFELAGSFTEFLAMLTPYVEKK
jgi:hypothetical protein